jgi:uncharacterized protein
MKHLLLTLCGATALAFSAAMARAAPSFDCTRVQAGSIAERVCRDPALSQLDRQLADVFAAAVKKARNERPPTLRAEQRGWIKGRDDCWKSSDIGACVTQSYERRIAELQARYRLLPHRGPDRYACAGDARNELLVSWFDTQPPTLYAERGDSVSLMFREAQPPAPGEVLYVGRNEALRLGGTGQLLVRWGVGAMEMACVKQP